MNTAIQEALEIIQLAREGEIDNDLRSIRYRIEKLLEKEKQQIIDSHVECVKRGTEKEGDTIFTKEDEKIVMEDIETYYNETYKQP